MQCNQNYYKRPLAVHVENEKQRQKVRTKINEKSE